MVLLTSTIHATNLSTRMPFRSVWYLSGLALRTPVVFFIVPHSGSLVGDKYTYPSFQ